jgi:hypothetical protein
MVTKTKSRPTMQDFIRVLLKSEKFLNWKPEQRFYEKSDRLRPEDLSPKFSAMEEHLTPQELAKAWGVSAEMIRIIFRWEPGVLRLPSQRANGKKRSYVSLKIPQSVAERVHRRLSALPQ